LSKYPDDFEEMARDTGKEATFEDRELEASLELR
jgi:hypothetical protein